MNKNVQPKPGMVSRSNWGARSGSCSTILEGVTKLAVHHCASNNTTVSNRTEVEHQKWLQTYFIDSLNYCDMGYHFNIGKDGTILEGRPEHLQGAHVSGHNDYTLSVSVHGNYDSRTFTWDQEEAMTDLLSWLCYEYDVEADDILGHFEFSGHAGNVCPGSNIKRALPRIKNTVEYRLNS